MECRVLPDRFILTAFNFHIYVSILCESFQDKELGLFLEWPHLKICETLVWQLRPNYGTKNCGFKQSNLNTKIMKLVLLQFGVAIQLHLIFLIDYS